MRYNNKEEALDALERFHTRYNLWIPTERNNPRQVVKKKDAFMKKKKPTSTSKNHTHFHYSILDASHIKLMLLHSCYFQPAI